MKFHSQFALLAVLVSAGCGASGSDSASSDPGNVGFGGGQDIGQFRDALKRSQIPSLASLDANGFFAEHFITPAKPDCGKVICASADTASTIDWFDENRHTMLRVALSTNVDPTQYKRKPMNLVVVVDRSGSMAADNRMEKVKSGLRLLVDGLDPLDRIALVSFDSNATIDVPFTESSERALLYSAIARLQPGSSTNIYDGLRLGFAQFGNGSFNERQNRVLLLSDGLATAGNTNRESMIALAEQKVATGIGLSTVGVGNSFDPLLMRGLAERGAGNFYFAEDAAAVNEVFQKELDYFIEPLALEVEISVAANGTYRLGEAIGNNYWQHDKMGGYGRMTLPAVFLASRVNQQPGGGRRGGGGSLFIHLVGDALRPAGSAATVQLKFRLPNQREFSTQVIEVPPPVVDPANPQVPVLSTQTMSEAVPMLHFYRGLRLATEVAQYSHDCAYTALSVLRDEATKWSALYPDFDITADLELVELFLDIVGQHRLGAGGSPRYLDGGGIGKDDLAVCVSRGDVCVDKECTCDESACQSTIREPQVPEDYDDSHHHDAGCSGSGNTGSAWLVGLVVVVVGGVRRRKQV